MLREVRSMADWTDWFEVFTRYTGEVGEVPDTHLAEFVGAVIDAEAKEVVVTTAEKLRMEGREQGELETQAEGGGGETARGSRGSRRCGRELLVSGRRS